MTTAPEVVPEERGLFATLVGDGRPLLYTVGVALMFSGGFALFLSAAGQFLPHDIAFLGMTPQELCDLQQCRVVDFMIHDRVAWGGTLIAIGLLYVWLTAYPLSNGEEWAWWAILLSSLVGFASFLGYLSYGYLDSWHGLGTMLLLPVLAVGLIRARVLVPSWEGPRVLFRPGTSVLASSRLGIGRSLLILAAAGMTVGGLVVTWVGISQVFVPQDLQFMGTTREMLDAINVRLVPLMAHDRVGFGGGVAAAGLTVLLCVWCARPTRSLWQVLALAWLAVSACAIGIHYIVGYDIAVHVAPAALGAALFAVGLIVVRRPLVHEPSPAVGVVDG